MCNELAGPVEPNGCVRQWRRRHTARGDGCRHWSGRVVPYAGVRQLQWRHPGRCGGCSQRAARRPVQGEPAAVADAALRMHFSTSRGNVPSMTRRRVPGPGLIAWLGRRCVGGRCGRGCRRRRHRFGRHSPASGGGAWRGRAAGAATQGRVEARNHDLGFKRALAAERCGAPGQGLHGNGVLDRSGRLSLLPQRPLHFQGRRVVRHLQRRYDLGVRHRAHRLLLPALSAPCAARRRHSHQRRHGIRGEGADAATHHVPSQY
mmetsp:Transcript_101323/g.272203  ORF Transcript_101323/g.272203 Transcript_101323/m.272203 type:complete len:261 (-) Transcript_101323:14-796(-)